MYVDNDNRRRNSVEMTFPRLKKIQSTVCVLSYGKFDNVDWLNASTKDTRPCLVVGIGSLGLSTTNLSVYVDAKIMPFDNSSSMGPPLSEGKSRILENCRLVRAGTDR